MRLGILAGLNQAWGDGKYLAATRVEGTRPDVVVPDAATGVQVGRVTYDGFCSAPVWYLHQSSTVVEMFMTEVNRSGAGLDFQAGHDGDSRPAWYVSGAGAGTASPTAAAPAQASAS